MRSLKRWIKWRPSDDQAPEPTQGSEYQCAADAGDPGEQPAGLDALKRHVDEVVAFFGLDGTRAGADTLKNNAAWLRDLGESGIWRIFDPQSTENARWHGNVLAVKRTASRTVGPSIYEIVAVNLNVDRVIAATKIIINARTLHIFGADGEELVWFHGTGRRMYGNDDFRIRAALEIMMYYFGLELTFKQVALRDKLEPQEYEPLVFEKHDGEWRQSNTAA